jgi:hypothetical protein
MSRSDGGHRLKIFQLYEIIFNICNYDRRRSDQKALKRLLMPSIWVYHFEIISLSKSKTGLFCNLQKKCVQDLHNHGDPKRSATSVYDFFLLRLSFMPQTFCTKCWGIGSTPSPHIELPFPIAHRSYFRSAVA